MNQNENEQESNKPKPQSSPSKIIIELNENNYNFDKKSFKQEYLSGIITRQEWDQFILDASKVIGQCWGKKKTMDQIKLPKMLVILGIVCVLLTFAYIITLFIAATSDGDSTVLITISIICISVSTIMAAVLATYNFRRQLGKFQLLDDIMQQDMDEFLVAINTRFRGRLSFVYMPTTKWIECNIIDVRNIRNVDEANRLISNENIFTERVNDEARAEENGGRQSDRHSRESSNRIQ